MSQGLEFTEIACNLTQSLEFHLNVNSYPIFGFFIRSMLYKIVVSTFF